jgi:hypothetical protein
VLKGDKIHADDTPVPVLDPGRGRTATGRLWVYAVDDRASGNTTPPATWYRFTADRTGAHPQAHLAGFRGFLQADAYAGYDGLYRSGATEVACWAHFRRKVFDLHERVATPLTTDILERIGTLYGIEAEVRGRPPDVRLAARQNRTKPLVDALREALDAGLRRLSPKSDIAKAIAMARSDGPRCAASSMTGAWRSITTSPNARCAALPSDGETGCSLVRRRAASAPQRSTPSSRPARPMASTRRPTSPTSLERSQLIGPLRDGTSSCPGTGPSSLRSR